MSEPLLVHKVRKGDNGLDEPSFLSKLIFSWVNPLLSLGYSKPLELGDVPSLSSQDRAILAHRKFSREWDSLRRKQTSDNDINLVFSAITRVYFKETVLVAFFILLRTISVVLGPLLLYAFVNYSNGKNENKNEGWALVACLVVVKVIESFSHRHFFFSARRTGMRMRSALMVAVYEKQLKLSTLGRRRHSTGEIVNYIAVDAYRMGEFPMWFHVGWSSVLQLFLALIVLYGIVGIGVLPGLVPLLICGLLNVPFGKSLQKCQFEFMMAQDKRLRSTSEILNNMKIIKLHSWEEKFKSFIESFRETEFKWLGKCQYQKVYGTFVYWISPNIVSAVILFGCVLLDSAPLDAGTIFTVLAVLRNMSEPVRVLPEAISALIQVKVSFNRINAFLKDDELKREETRSLEPASSRSCIRILGGHFRWEPESSTPTLRDVNLEVSPGQKLAVCGSVGAGKSSLLCALCYELNDYLIRLECTNNLRK